MSELTTTPEKMTDGAKPVFSSYAPTDKVAPPRLGFIILILVVLIAVGLYSGFIPRWKQRQLVIAETKELAVPSVAVVAPGAGKAEAPLTLPAELRALNDAAIYGRANGYVKRWLVDIGAVVKEGQVLAEIDTPEVSQQLLQSRAEQVRAEAALDLAKTTAVRWENLVKTKAVGEQEVAEKQGDVKLQTANVNAQMANVRRLEEMLDFGRITAPFSGTITERHVDVGDLVASDKGKVLFRLVQISTLRAFVRVPQFMARSIQVGQSAEVTVPELPGKIFTGKVLRTAGAMDSETRTLLTELEVDNSKGELLAGSFAQAGFPDTTGNALLTLPANCLLIRPEGSMVAVVGADSKVQLCKLTLGRDFGSTVEVISGVKAEDKVVINPFDAITDGAEVRVMETKPEKPKA